MNLLQQHIDSMVAGAEQRMPQWAIDPHEQALASVIRGESDPFWRLAGPGRYDCEQELPIFAALRRACQLPGATPAERWAVVERAIVEQATVYADHVAPREAA